MKDKVFSLIKEEQARQNETINLIASENYAPEEVMAATGSILTNKYAEGVPGRRYYGGTKIVDQVERLAIDRAKKLFNAEHANVQPHSGAQANMAAYLALIRPGDTVLAQSLTDGGHLTHGASVNFSGKFYNFVHYGVDPKTNLLNYKHIERLAKKHKPKLIVAGYSAYSRTLDFKKFKAIADSVDAKLLVDMAHFAGLVAAGVHPSPVRYADVVTSTTHKTLRGPRGGLILCKSEYTDKIDKAVFPGVQGGPLEHVIAAKAICFELAGRSSFKTYAKQVIKNARVLSSALQGLGLEILTGGSDNHMFLVNVKNTLSLTGKEAEEILEEAGIVLNKNTIPGETESPFVTSGIRIGTPSVTTRGMKEKEMKIIAHAIYQTLTVSTPSDIKKIKIEMLSLAKRFPIY